MTTDTAISAACVRHDWHPVDERVLFAGEQSAVRRPLPDGTPEC
jgi:hypothetical protein